MTCSHPDALLEEIRDTDGRRGLRCTGCGTYAFSGDRVWTILWRSFRAWLNR